MEPQIAIEAVELAPAAPIAVSEVTWPASAAAPERFVHLHAAVELVIFEHVSGVVTTDGATYRLSPGAAVWLPSMAPHDFHLDRGPAAWILIHYHPQAASTDLGAGALCGVLPETDRARLSMIAAWLRDAIAQGRSGEARSLMDVVLAAVGRAEPVASGPSATPAAVAQLRPALERIGASQTASLPLTEAASLCGLSPSYFSRLFRRAFGHTFASHMLQARLKNAAVLLATTTDPIKVVSYRAGFRQHAYFTAQFRKLYGRTPSAFRRDARRRAEG